MSNTTYLKREHIAHVANDRDAYLRECTEIDPNDLNDEFVKIPGAIAYWNAQLAEATRLHAIAKLDYEREWARLFCTLRDGKGDKKAPAVDAIKAMCDTDDDLYELKLDVIEKDAERMRLRGIVDAVLGKRDMLQSLGAKLREEMRGDPTLRQNSLTG